jgi:hypothetical protein
MSWTTWLETVPLDTGDETMRQLYQNTRSMATGQPPDLVRLTSLTPSVASLLYDLQRTIDQEATGLSLREKEIAALVVSVFNGCVH